MEVDTEKMPAEGEVMVFSMGGGFVVKGTVQDVTKRLSTEDWPVFELAESGDHVVIRSAQVIAIRGGSKPKRTHIGFASNRD